MCAHMAGKQARALVNACEVLGRALAGAKDMCAVAWDDSAAPRIACTAGAVHAVLGTDDVVGKPAAVLFTGGERAARDLAQAAAKEPFEEYRSLLRGGKPFQAQHLLSAAPGGAVARGREVRAPPAGARAL